MDNLNQYIDICLIDEYVNKDCTLYVDELSDHEVSNFLDKLIKHDDEVKEFIFNHMQKLINERLEEYELAKREASGLTLVQLSNGDKALQAIQY